MTDKIDNVPFTGNLTEDDLIELWQSQGDAKKLRKTTLRKLRTFLGALGFAAGVACWGTAVAIGDSNLGNAYGVNATGNNAYFHQRGTFNWFQAMANYPYAHYIQYYGNTISAATNQPPAGHNVGIGSTYTRDMLVRLRRDALTKNPRLLLIWGGTNDVTDGRSATEISRNLFTMCRLALENGVQTVWLHTIAPRNDRDGKQFTTDQKAVAAEVNRRIRAFCAVTAGVELVDLDVLADANGDLDTRYDLDGLHLGSTGSEYVARVCYLPLWRRERELVALRRDLPEAFDATNAPFGNLLPNASFATTTGGTAGSGVTGTLPSGWSLTCTGTGISATASVVDRKNISGDDVKAIRAVVASAGTGADTSDRIVLTTTTDPVTSNVAANTWYHASCEVVIPAGTAALLRAIYLEQKDTSGTDTSQRMFSSRYSYTHTNVSAGTVVKDVLPNGDLRLVLRTPELFCEGTEGIGFQIRVDLDGTIAGSRNIEFMEPILSPLPFVPSLAIDSTFRPISRIAFHTANNAGTTYTNAPSGTVFLGSSSRHVTKTDLSAAQQIRLHGYLLTAGATGAKAILRYATAYSTTATDFADVGSSEVSVSLTTGATYVDSGWIDIKQVAMNDVFLAVILTGGDGAADPQFSNIHCEFR